jgi:glucose/arabinose dehydrogenase
MALGDEGTLFIGTMRPGKVYAVKGLGSDHTEVVTIAEKLYVPNGVAFRDGALYVAEINRILKYKDIEKSLDEPPEAEVVTDSYPTDRHHGWRYIDFGPDGYLYVPIGAPCNVCDEPGYAVITRIRPDGTGRETFARGIRNTVGFTWHPETGELWFTDNGRDLMGDDIPPGELNHAPRIGMDFGFPYCHGGDIPETDKKLRALGSCEAATPPAARLGPHVAPLGLLFYTGEQFPPEYRGQVFIAEHGSWNRSEKIGYRVSLVRFDEGRPVSYEPFATGWLAGDDVTGRPVDVLEHPDGSLLVSDDRRGVIYRISYLREEA